MNLQVTFRISYHIVATAFGIMMIFFILNLLMLPFAGHNMSPHPADGPETDIIVGIQKRNTGKGVDTLSERTSHSEFLVLATDTAENNRLNHLDAKIRLPLRYFQHSAIVPYWFFTGQWILNFLSWLYLLYQVFLVLYDCRRGHYFSRAQIARMNKATLSMLMLAFLHLISHEFTGSFSAGGNLIIGEPVSRISFSLLFYVYLVLTAVLRGFTGILQSGLKNNPPTN